MLAIFQTIGESCPQRTWYLRDGEAARVGRTEWAEWAVPADRDMRDIHFSVNCFDGGCLIDDLTDGRTMVNGEHVENLRLSNGDQIQAGNTRFRVTIEGEVVDVAEPASGQEGEATVEAETNDESVFAPMVAEIAEAAELEPNYRQVVAGQEDYRAAPAALVARADDAGVHARDKERWLFAALRFLSFALPVEEGVRWAYDGQLELLGNELPKEDQAARESAFQWLDDPSAENSKQADTAAQATGLRSSAGWLAMAAAWSQGIQREDDGSDTDDTGDKGENDDGEAPTKAEVQQRDPWLSARAVAGAVTMAVIEAKTDTIKSCRNLLDAGLKAKK